jgi:hypothetical protein
VARVGEERAPVSGGTILRLEAKAREVAVARRQSGEGESWRGGERTWPAAAGFPFKGGLAGWQRRGGGFRGAQPTHGGSGGERGGAPGVAGEWLGSGPRPAGVGGVLPRDSGGWWGRGDAGRRG